MPDTVAVETACAELAQQLDGINGPGLRLREIARQVSSFFGLNLHEVALFVHDPGREALIFSWPQGARGIGDIPVSAPTSLAARTATERVPRVENAFSTMRHLHVFEHLLVDSHQRIPIQKIMSVPLLEGEELKGVMQVSRKGTDPEAAGQDFTPEDLARLEQLAAVAAQYL